MGKVMVLVYHRVSPATDTDFLDTGGVPRITPENLQLELGFLADLGARFLTYRDLREGNFPASHEIGIIVTFDDGFRDSYQLGLPVVEALGGRAVVFQCTAMLDAHQGLPEHRLYHGLFKGNPEERQENRRILIRNLTKVTTSDITDSELLKVALMKAPFRILSESLDAMLSDYSLNLELLYPDNELLQQSASAGHEIGSHGHQHLHRATLSDAEFESELTQSVGALETVLGGSPKAFSYPFGALVAGDAERCSRYFKQLATCERSFISRSTPPLQLGRFSWPGTAPNHFRLRRWLLTGGV